MSNGNQCHVVSWSSFTLVWFEGQPESETWPKASKQVTEQEVPCEAESVGVSSQSGVGLIEGAAAAPTGLQEVTDRTETVDSSQGAAAAAAASGGTSGPHSQV